MSVEERFQRPEPPRTGPIRDFGQLAGAQGGGSAGQSGTASPQAIDQVVANAVRAGYQVVEEHIKQGRFAAERFRQGRYETADIPDDVRLVSARLLQLAKDLSTTWFDLIAAVMRDPGMRAAFEKPELGPAPSKPPGSGPAPAPTVTYRVNCAKPYEVTPFVPGPITGPAVPASAGLFALDASLKPIRQVSFRPADDRSGLVVQIDIPEDQPAGVYTGAVIDSDSHQPIGTLRVRVLG